MTVLDSLTDTRSTGFGLASAAVVGALTLVDPHQRSPLKRFAYRSAVAAFSGVSCWLALDDPEEYVEPAARAGIAVGAAGVVFGMSSLSESVDGWSVRQLGRIGVPRPRVAMAIGAAACVLADHFLLRKDQDADDARAEDDHEPTTAPVPAEVRSLTDALLACTEDHGAFALRGQLKTALVEHWGDEHEPGLVGFRVDSDLPKAVPGTGQFPVLGYQTLADGTRFRITVHVLDGELSALTVEHEEGEVEPTAWPTPAQVEFAIETPSGEQPV